jgi:hypothetical protein
VNREAAQSQTAHPRLTERPTAGAATLGEKIMRVHSARSLEENQFILLTQTNANQAQIPSKYGTAPTRTNQRNHGLEALDIPSCPIMSRRCLHPHPAN